MTPVPLRKYKKEYARTLVGIARGDLDSAIGLQKSGMGRPENIFFMCAQSIEKSLKAVTCHLGKSVLHSHDLEALLSHLPEEAVPPRADAFAALSPFSSAKRYEEGFEVYSKEDIDAVIRFGASLYP